MRLVETLAEAAILAVVVTTEAEETVTVVPQAEAMVVEAR